MQNKKILLNKNILDWFYWRKKKVTFQVSGHFWPRTPWVWFTNKDRTSWNIRIKQYVINMVGQATYLKPIDIKYLINIKLTMHQNST